MFLDVDSAQDTLTKMGVAEDDMPFALDATRSLVHHYGPSRQEQAAEFVATAMNVSGLHGASILLLPSLMHFAERLAN